jgi:hypothetical protein
VTCAGLGGAGAALAETANVAETANAAPSAASLRKTFIVLPLSSTSVCPYRNSICSQL